MPGCPAASLARTPDSITLHHRRNREFSLPLDIFNAEVANASKGPLQLTAVLVLLNLDTQVRTRGGEGEGTRIGVWARVSLCGEGGVCGLR